MRELHKSLILNSILHPIKFILRFIALHLIMDIITQRIYYFNDFLYYTQIGKLVYVISLAYLAMKWVRSSVQSDYEERLRERNSTSSQNQKAQNKAQMRNMLVNYLIYRNMKRQAEEETKNERRRQYARDMYNNSAINYKWAKQSGNYREAEQAKKDAKFWKYRM